MYDRAKLMLTINIGNLGLDFRYKIRSLNIIFHFGNFYSFILLPYPICPPSISLFKDMNIYQLIRVTWN